MLKVLMKFVGHQIPKELEMLLRGETNFFVCSLRHYSVPANTYLFKVNNRNTIRRCGIGSKLTIKISE